jgi:hypothetical protein
VGIARDKMGLRFVVVNRGDGRDALPANNLEPKSNYVIAPTCSLADKADIEDAISWMIGSPQHTATSVSL